METIGTTSFGYKVLAIPPVQPSPMANHMGEIAVDDETRTMFVWVSLLLRMGLTQSCVLVSHINTNWRNRNEYQMG